MRAHFKFIGWTLFILLLAAGCSQSPAGVPVRQPTAILVGASPTTPPPATPVELTPSPVPTQAPTETATPTPSGVPTSSGASSPAGAIQHFTPGQEVAISAIDMLDEQNGWATGNLSDGTDHILRSGDGGNTWTDVTPPQQANEGVKGLKAAGAFLDTDRAWVVFSQSDGTAIAQTVVWHTQNGGMGWEASQPLDLNGVDSQFYVSNVQFIDPQNGWLLAHVGVGMSHDYVMFYRTQDGGATWQKLIDPYTDGDIQPCYKPGMEFADAQQGWLPVDCGGVMPGAILYHTADGGSKWETVKLPSPSDLPTLFENPSGACGVDDITFFTPAYGKLAMTCSNYDTDPVSFLYYLYTTQDGGATWTSTVYPGGSLTFLNDQVGWAQNKDIYQTKDGGLTWTKIANVSWEGAFDFISEQVGWAIATSGEEKALVKSEDGGVYWNVIKPVIVP